MTSWGRTGARRAPSRNNSRSIRPRNPGRSPSATSRASWSAARVLLRWRATRSTNRMVNPTPIGSSMIPRIRSASRRSVDVSSPWAVVSHRATTATASEARVSGSTAGANGPGESTTGVGRSSVPVAPTGGWEVSMPTSSGIDRSGSCAIDPPMVPESDNSAVDPGAVPDL